MAVKNIPAVNVLDKLEYVLEVLAKNYIGEAKTELASLIVAIDSCGLPEDLLLKVQCNLIEGRNYITGANFDIPKSSHFLWEAYKQLKSYLRSVDLPDQGQQIL